MKLNDFFDHNMSPNWDLLLKTFPEMDTCHHSTRWHREGSVTNHTRLVYNAMKERIKDVHREDYKEWSLIMLSAALFHDIGKISTTYFDEKQGDWCCKSHGEAGEKLFRKTFFEERLDLREKVAYLIRYHMLLHHTMQKDAERQKKELIQMIYGLMPIEDMLLLNECDMRGSLNENNNEDNIARHISKVKNAVEEIKKDRKSNPFHYVNESSARMYVMIGVPGSGKSTYAEVLKDTENEKVGTSLPIISRDLIRIEMGMCGEGEKCMGTHKQENEVTRRVKESIQNLSSMGMSFIVDNTSLKKKYRDQYINYIQNYDVAPIYVYVEAPSLEENFKRRDGEIDSSIIQRMWDGFEFPNHIECYEMWLVDQRTNNTYKL